MIFGNLFGGKKSTASPAPSAPTVGAAPRLKSAFGRYFGEYSDGSTFFDRALAGAAIANGDYGAGATIRSNAAQRFQARKAEEEKKRREALYASPFANLGGVQSDGYEAEAAPMAQAEPMPNPSALSLDPIEPQFDEQGRQVEQVTVMGQRARKPAIQAPEPVRLQPSQLAGAYRQKARLAAQEGDITTMQASLEMADKIELEARQNQGSLIASQFGPIAGDVPSMAQMRNLNDPSGDVLARDEQRSNDINDTIGELTRMGVQLSPTQIEGLRDPMTRERVMNQLIAAGDPTKATESALDVWKSRNEFRPLQFENAGGSIIGLDPRTGRKFSEFEKSASPGERIQQQIARENIASRQRIARIQANTTMTEGQKNRAIKQEQLNLRRQISQWERRTGSASRAGPDVDVSGDDWVDDNDDNNGEVQ
jgi:hypothetical protein